METDESTNQKVSEEKAQSSNEQSEQKGSEESSQKKTDDNSQKLNEKKPGEEIDILNEFQYFQLMFSNEIIDSLVEESNNFYKNILFEKYGPDYRTIVMSKKAHNTYPYLFVTKGISREDILAFIGIRMYMGLHKYPNIECYWTDSILYKNIVNSIMNKTYFFLISKSLHFPEYDKDEKDDKSSVSNVKIDPRHKIKNYLEKLAQNFQKYYVLGKNVTIDESLLQYKGRNSMKFYIPMKPHKYGFKIHLLCDSDTHYLYNMLFDPGKNGKEFMNFEDNSSLTESIVLRLLSCIKDNKQRNVFFDGWYSSISLMKKLTKMGYLNTTVLRNNSKELPEKIKLSGYDKAYNDGILIQKYEGRKTILFATNYEVDKEELRNIYNIKNRGVDTFDQYLEISSIQRRTKKWYQKIFLFGIDASIINAKIVYELRSGKSLTTVKFKEKIIEHIFKMYMDHCKRNGKTYNSQTINNSIYHGTNISSKFGKFKHTHNVGHIINNKRPCKHCNKKTPYFCLECTVPLHPECFTDYHNKKNASKK